MTMTRKVIYQRDTATGDFNNPDNFRPVETTYKIIRFFQRGGRAVIETGLTLEQAQLHCRDPETSSKTATSPQCVTRTAISGEWFDGYEEERR